MKSAYVTIEKDSKGVFFIVEGEYPMTDKIEFYRQSSSPLEAQLLCEELRSQLDKLMETIRRESYEKGWKDKAGHRVGKDEWFSSYMGRKP